MLETYVRPILAFAIGRTDNSNEAEELAQEIMFQAVSALSKSRAIANRNAFIWSIAHNTYKRWLARRRVDGSRAESGYLFSSIIKPVDSPESTVVDAERASLLRRELSLLAGNYRMAIVHHYYGGLSCEQTAREMGISTDMVKFYLSGGRKKLREGMEVAREFRERSFSPSAFSIYKSGWSTVNIWPLFTRKLPGNIVLASYSTPLDIQAMSLETGVPTAFLEDEVKILCDVGLMKEAPRGRYQTAFFIADAELIKQVRSITHGPASLCVEALEQAFREVLPTMESLELFKFEAPEARYRWLFMQLQNILDIPFSTDYPSILLDGSENFIWGEEAESPLWSGGRTPYEGPGHVLYAIDIARLGFRHQDYLRYKGPALADLARGTLDVARAEEYATLVRDGYALRVGDTAYPNIPTVTPETSRAAQAAIDKATQGIRDSIDMQGILRDLEVAITPHMTKVIKGRAREYASLILSVHFESCIWEGMHAKGYLSLPEPGDNTPVTSFLLLA